jgi:hypothetical protein
MNYDDGYAGSRSSEIVPAGGSSDDQKKGRELEKALAVIEDTLKTQWNWYEAHVDQQAKIAFHRHVKPFCRKHGLRFNAGMGVWGFFAPGEREAYCKERPFQDTEEWDRLCDLLEMCVPGMDANSLGSLMTSETLSPTEPEELP